MSMMKQNSTVFRLEVLRGVHQVFDWDGIEFEGFFLAHWFEPRFFFLFSWVWKFLVIFWWYLVVVYIWSYWASQADIRSRWRPIGHFFNQKLTIQKWPGSWLSSKSGVFCWFSMTIHRTKWCDDSSILREVSDQYGNNMCFHVLVRLEVPGIVFAFRLAVLFCSWKIGVVRKRLLPTPLWMFPAKFWNQHYIS